MTLKQRVTCDQAPFGGLERMNLAWRLVREGARSDAETVREAAVAVSIVTRMRIRWREMIASSHQPSGDWYRDRCGCSVPEGPEEARESLDIMVAIHAQTRELEAEVATLKRVLRGRREQTPSTAH